MTVTILLFIGCLAYIVIPILLLLKLWRDRSTDLLNWGLWTLTSGVYVSCLFYIGVWPMTIVGFYFRYVLLISYLIASLKSFFNCKRKFVPITKIRFASLTIGGVICLFQIWNMSSAYVSSFHIPEGIQLDFPLKNGEYYIAQGGNHLAINHHYEISAQKYAIDIIKLNKLGLRCNSLNAGTLEKYNIFGDTIYSPCNGKVIELVDGFPDLEPGQMDPEHLAGNHLVIEMDEQNVLILLAHIMKNSFLIKEGDVIKQGQPIAKVGNSGNTSEPHLHMHVVKNKSGDLLETGNGIPMTFNDRFLVRNDRIHSSFR